MLLPHWRGFSCNAYMRNIQFQTPQHWFDAIPNHAQPSYPMQLIVVWNRNAREALDSANKDWFRLLNQDVSEAHWLPLDPRNPATPLRTHQHLATNTWKNNFTNSPLTLTAVHACALRQGQPSFLPITERRSHVRSKIGKKSPTQMAV
eukprot:1161071-Pelagomonas_calceolata.AAC.8